ncbi:MAG: glycosyltransferase [Bacteroidales bacterium]|nr:glycosyltransferase [Bacteroidales bacterium]
MASNSSDNPLVSIIVPNYNYARFLRQRMESVLNQTYCNTEIIILDDCSTDESASIIKQYVGTDDRIKCFIENSENSGSPFRQWAKGISFANGEFIWIAESDDDADLTLLAECVKLLVANPQASLCYTGSYTVDENNNPTDIEYDNWTEEHLKHPFAIYDGKKFVSHNMYWTNYIYNASCVVFRKSAYDKLTDTSWQQMKSCGDWHFWTMMATVGDVISIHQKLNKFRRHSNSVTARSTNLGEHFKVAMTECMNLTFFIENNFGVKKGRRRLSHGYYLLLYKRKKIAPEYKNSLIADLRNRVPHLTFDYIYYRIYRFLKKFFKSIDAIKNDRLCN